MPFNDNKLTLYFTELGGLVWHFSCIVFQAKPLGTLFAKQMLSRPVGNCCKLIFCCVTRWSSCLWSMSLGVSWSCEHPYQRIVRMNRSTVATSSLAWIPENKLGNTGGKVPQACKWIPAMWVRFQAIAMGCTWCHGDAGLKAYEWIPGN